jgi:predicted RNase H-like HicB family nuclease
MKWTIESKKTEEGNSVFCPGLPGCWSQDDSEKDALDNIRDAIQEYLAANEVAH